MNWDWITGSAYQVSNFQRIKNSADTNAQKTASLARRVDELERELEGMRIVHRAFLEVIAEKLDLQDEEVEAKLRHLAAEESKVVSCPGCQRPRSKRPGPCMYCGAAEPMPTQRPRPSIPVRGCSRNRDPVEARFPRDIPR